MNQAVYSFNGRGSDFVLWTWISVKSDSEGDSEEGADFDVSSIVGPEMASTISGIVGLCLTSFLWIIVSWRLFYHYSSWCNKCWHYRADGLTVKQMLHALLWTTMIIEGVAYAIMVGTNSSNKLTYTLLDIVGRGILEYCTFIIGTAHWFDVIFQARSGNKQSALMLYPVILAIVTLAVTVASIFEAVDLLSGTYSTVDIFREHSRIYRITLLVESVGWGIHAVIVVTCAGVVYGRISSLPTFSQVRSEARRNIMNKMIIPMVFCALSYALRSGYMAADFASRILMPDTTFEAGVGWWVGNCWLPTLIPSTMLLYSIRKRDRDNDIGIPETILQSPQTEAHDDPFRSFQQNFRDYDEEDEVAETKNLPGLRSFEDEDQTTSSACK
ncbi:hypothetical protein ACHAXA_009302 [Cyclostephanos tholiformis]|uniref:Transmembrane protein n=1 Tax=Cyclostephanos tholiformis TaxID=382380 RepID=A0ABD3R9G1_9STRA